ncbi:MAG TPA: hypothetical protein VIV40_11510, partial [Kofleriaceae bacterium]
LDEYLVQYGEVIGYAAVGVFALISLGIIQLMRRRADAKKARIAVRLASYSISEPRQGPIAVTGTHHQTQSERWLECKGQRVTLDGPVEVVRGTRARWQRGERTYTVKDGDVAIAIGIMSRRSDGPGWRLVSSPGENGIQLFAVQPTPAPPPLWPWRAPLILAVCGGIAFFGLYQLGTFLVDVPRDKTSCSESSRLRLQIATALPLVREDALGRLQSCALSRGTGASGSAPAARREP